MVNAFFRNEAKVLASGFFAGVEAAHASRFAERVLLINNVSDSAAALEQARALISRGEFDRVEVVSEHLPAALAATELTAKVFGERAHFTDFLLVAPLVASRPYYLYHDGDVTVTGASSWVAAGLELLRARPEVLVVSPTPQWWHQNYELTTEVTKDYFFGYGFSDQLFLARTVEMRQPIYHYHCPASLRYPASHWGSSFEQRVDSYMRCTGRLRALDRHSGYLHFGKNWKWPRRASEWPRFARNRLISRTLKLSPYRRDARWKV